MDGLTSRQMDRQTDLHTDRWTYRQAGRQIERQTDKYTNFTDINTILNQAKDKLKQISPVNETTCLKLITIW
jgi:hypothetical protein